jgi:hypothetical protein
VPSPDSASSIEGSASQESDGGLSVPYIATIAVGGALLILVVAMVLSRGRRGTSDGAASSAFQPSYDGEYLQRADHNASFEVDDLDLQSQAKSRNSRTLPEPIIITTFSSCDDESELEADPFTSRVPSKRSKRGPLGSQDELDRGMGDEESVVGNHRGGGNGNSPRMYALADTVDL